MANRLGKTLEEIEKENDPITVLSTEHRELTEQPRIHVTVVVNDDEPKEFDLDTLFMVGIHKGGLDEENGRAEMATACVGGRGGGYSKAIRSTAERFLKERYPLPSDALGGLSELLEMLKGAAE
jgi:hypothetical protein